MQNYHAYYDILENMNTQFKSEQKIDEKLIDDFLKLESENDMYYEEHDKSLHIFRSLNDPMKFKKFPLEKQYYTFIMSECILKKGTDVKYGLLTNKLNLIRFHCLTFIVQNTANTLQNTEMKYIIDENTISTLLNRNK